MSGMTETNKDFLGMCFDLTSMEVELNEWEQGFVNNLIDRLKAGQSLTAKQRKCLVETYIKYARQGELSPEGVDRYEKRHQGV